jgi:signal peptidase
VLVIALPLIWAFWPARYGGHTTLTVVSGASMEPTYRSGDLVIVRKGPFLEGDVVLYQIPEGQPGEGGLVIHRVQEILPSGQLLIQGDNKEHFDPWQVTSDDVVGTARYVVPGVGRIFTSAWVWLALALTIGVAVAWAVWPTDEDEEGDEGGDDRLDGSNAEGGGVTMVAPGTGDWPDGPVGPGRPGELSGWPEPALRPNEPVT